MLPDARLTSVPLTACAAVRRPNIQARHPFNCCELRCQPPGRWRVVRRLAPKDLAIERRTLGRVDVGGDEAVALALELGDRDVVPGVVPE